MYELFKKSVWTLQYGGVKDLFVKSLKFLTKKKLFADHVDLNAQYSKWIKRQRSTKLPNVKGDILISIIFPVWNPPKDALVEALKSVVQQKYKNWELCIVDDCSTESYVKEVLESFSKKDERIKLKFRKKNGHISRASNDALKMAKGKYIALMDNDDLITEDALLRVVFELEKNPRIDMIYSDEDKINSDGKHLDPFFKPDFSQDLIYSMMYPTHLAVYRKKIIDEIGGFRVGYEGSQDYDLFLRFWEKASVIHHIPKILYHWRKIAGSTAVEINGKSYAIDAAKKALGDSIKRKGIDGEIVGDMYPFRLKRRIIGNPKVSIIIPIRDKVEYLVGCLDAIFSITQYENYEVIIVDNESSEKKTLRFLRKLERDRQARVHRFEGKFNFSAINNFGVSKARGEYILFLNNDTKPVSDEWLEALLEHAQREEVAVVGGKLIYPSGLVQSAGLVVGLGGCANSVYQHIPEDSLHYFNLLNAIRNCSALTAACMMVKKSTFIKLGGFDAKNFPANFQDVDFCLKGLEKGLLNVYTPFSKVVHFESVSRIKKPTKVEEIFFSKKWKKYMKHDPYYNPNFSRRNLNYSLL
jgi:GT2 family glycosyltransferase